jgi:glycosyltransferase involved in cell wall biosynthesis
VYRPDEATVWDAVTAPRDLPVLVTVILAVRNGAPWISEQLESLARQKTRLPFELVVADNGSTDGTRQLVESFRYRIPRLRLVDASDRRGQRNAQRAGVAASEGDLLLFVDADDVCPPGWLDAMAETARDCDFVAGAIEVDTLNDEHAIRARPFASTTGVRRPAESLSAGPYAIGANLGVWRSAWDRVDDPSMDLPPTCRGGGEDRDLSFSLRRAGCRIGFCASPALAYRLRPPGRSTRRQMRSYGIADAALVKRYRDLGARGDRPALAARKYALLIPRAIKARLEGDEAHWARNELAVALGRVEGSLRYRVLCL